MIEAVIFDMDGVIADTMELHYEAERKTLEGAGAKFDLWKRKGLVGVPAKHFFESELKEQGIKVDANELLENKYKAMNSLVKTIKPYKGVVELISELEKNGFRLAVASASRKDFVVNLLRHLKVDGKFSAIIGFGDYEKGKPNPDAFLMAAEKLRVKPENCLVVEDAPLGVKAGKAAGMKVVAITNTYSRKELAEADRVISGFRELKIGEIRKMN